MTAFVKQNFYINGDYVDYNIGDKSKFVARFKYAKGGKASFVSFLIKNFSVEEYFSRLENQETPIGILETKGYVQPHVKKMLKAAGYPQTLAGRKAFISAQVAAR
jgi:hypothetical protein